MNHPVQKIPAITPYVHATVSAMVNTIRRGSRTARNTIATASPMMTTVAPRMYGRYSRAATAESACGTRPPTSTKVKFVVSVKFLRIGRIMRVTFAESRLGSKFVEIVMRVAVRSAFVSQLNEYVYAISSVASRNSAISRSITCPPMLVIESMDVLSMPPVSRSACVSR